jgi:hypothetical protein
MRPLRHFFHGTAACLMLVGCASATSSGADNGEAGSALRAAVEKTLSVDSFHAQTTFQEPSGRGPATGTIDYQAPDREHERFVSGRRVNETISIGDTVYVTATNKPGFFWKIAGGGIGAADVLTYFHLLEHAENVRLDGNLYHFDLPSVDAGGPGQGPTTGTATLTDDALLHTLLIHVQLGGGEGDVGFTYGDYDSGIKVEPPSSDLIVKTPLIGCPTSVPSASGVLPNGSHICPVLVTPAPSP